MTSQDENAESEEKESRMSRKTLMLFVVGFLTIFAGAAVLMIAGVLYSGGQASFGTIIFIGPIPVVIGAGPGATWIVSVAIVLAVLTIVMFLVMQRQSKKGDLHES